MTLRAVAAPAAPTPSGVASVTGTLVDNTDPSNPVVDLPVLDSIADAEDATDVVTKFNSLLADLKAKGYMAAV